MSAKVCILVFSDIARDGRVLREIEYARRQHEVDVIAHGDWSPPEGVRFFSLPRTTWSASIRPLALLLAGNLNSNAWERYFWQRREYRQAVDLLRRGEYDLIHANDLEALPVAVTAAQGMKTRVLFDAHEYSLDTGEETWRVKSKLRALFHKYILRTYGRGIGQMTTVAPGISALYRACFGWDSKVIMNAPLYVKHDFHPVDPSHIDLVHHGGTILGRNIEDLIAMMPELDERFHLSLILIPVNRAYFASLRQSAERTAPHRIHFLDPVPPDAITARVNQFDIGIHFMRGDQLNRLHALPNKFFEYIVAGLGIAVSPLPEMEAIVREHRIGVVSPDQKIRSMARTLNQLTPGQIDEFKRNSLSLATTLNGDTEMTKLMSIYAEMLSKPKDIR